MAKAARRVALGRTKGTTPGGGRPANDLGPKIRQARKQAGLTQQQLAAPDVTKAFISHIELGRARPSLASLYAIARKLGKDVEYFTPGHPAGEQLRIDVHIAAARASAAGRDWARAEEEAVKAIALKPERRKRLTLLRLLAAVRNRSGRPAEALDAASEALTLLEERTDPSEWVGLMFEQGSAYARMGDLQTGLEALERAREALERQDVQDPDLASSLFIALGTTYRRLGRATRALGAYERALAAATQTSDLRYAGRAYLGMAAAHYDAGEYTSAIRYYERAHEQLKRANDHAQEIGALRSLAEVLTECGQLPRARALAAKAMNRARALGDEHEVAVAKVALAKIALSERRAARALSLAAEAGRALRTFGDAWQQADALRVVGAAHHLARRWSASDRAYKDAIAMLKAIDNRSLMQRVATDYAEKLYARGLGKRAYEVLAGDRPRRRD